MIYFMIIASIIVADKILKEYFKSSFQGKHREVRTKGNGFGVRKEAGKQKVKENLFRKKEQNKAELKQKRNNKEKNDWKNNDYNPKKYIHYVTFCYISFVLTVGCAWNRFFLYFCR